MITKVQSVQFGAVLKFVIEQVTNATVQSDAELFAIIKNLPLKQKTGIWLSVSLRIGSTPSEVHDYFFNTWQLQFFQSHNSFKNELKELFYKTALQYSDSKNAINKTLEEFQQKYPNNCNERKLKQILYRYAHNKGGKQVLEKSPEPLESEIMFQNLMEQLNLIQ
ncbi:Conserved_hypothetical protein [Hexamita inflata]|uniref:Uncharacterized protein n=1 Tax=Hexamita inflata TaxID=28002 RepID=A0AA86TDI2_9EUKA|nr:Conserved hypothetical protein [Hexamita inflata]CAI9915624.1 Conserved hypothetical protein [Hexamita inflata]